MGKARTAFCKGAAIALQGSEDFDTKFEFLWIVDFPLFARKTDANGIALDDPHLESVHHPFTRPVPEHMGLLRSDPLQVILERFCREFSSVIYGS